MEGDFLNKIWDFFSNERISLTPKITIPLFLIIIVFLFVDYYGFFYYYANSKKVEYLSKIEEAKEKSSSDTIGKSSVSCPLKPSDSAPLKHSTMPP